MYPGLIVETRLTGRSAILQHKIDKVRQEIAMFAGFPSDLPEGRLRELAQLEDELEHESKTKRVVVLGTEHGCQRNGNSNNAALAERLLLLIERFAVTLVMEEWSTTKEASFASTLVAAPIEYVDVGTPSEEQFVTYRFPIHHPSYDGTLGDCQDCPSMSEYGPLGRQENREQRMLHNIQTAMGSHNVGLFIVGLSHLHSMSSKLLSVGFNVTAFEWLGRLPGTNSMSDQDPH